MHLTAQLVIPTATAKFKPAMEGNQKDIFHGWLATSATSPLTHQAFIPKAWKETDVDIKVSHCGVCASDLHSLRSGWVSSIFSLHAPHISFLQIYGRNSQTDDPNPFNRAQRSIPSASATKSSAPPSESAPALDQASQSVTAWASDPKATHVGDQVVKPAQAGGKITVHAASGHTGTGTPTAAYPMAALRTFVAMIHTACFRSPREWRARMRRSCCARGVRCMSR